MKKEAKEWIQTSVFSVEALMCTAPNVYSKVRWHIARPRVIPQAPKFKKCGVQWAPKHKKGKNPKLKKRWRLILSLCPSRATNV